MESKIVRPIKGQAVYVKCHGEPSEVAHLEEFTLPSELEPDHVLVKMMVVILQKPLLKMNIIRPSPEIL